MMSLGALPSSRALAYAHADAAIDGAHRVAAADLAGELSGPVGGRPYVLQVGALSLYKRGRVPGAFYAGMASMTEGLAELGHALVPIGRTAPVVVYCGCCPWTHCANVAPAFRFVRDRGYSSVRVLYLPSDFTTDWVDAGHPVEAG